MPHQGNSTPVPVTPAFPLYPLLFTRKTACRALSMSLRKFDTLLAKKAIKVKRINGGVYIHRDVLLAFASSDQPVLTDSAQEVR